MSEKCVVLGCEVRPALEDFGTFGAPGSLVDSRMINIIDEFEPRPTLNRFWKSFGRAVKSIDLSVDEDWLVRLLESLGIGLPLSERRKTHILSERRSPQGFEAKP